MDWPEMIPKGRFAASGPHRVAPSTIGLINRVQPTRLALEGVIMGRVRDSRPNSWLVSPPSTGSLS